MAHRVFKPVILFHDHSYSTDPSGVTHRIHIPYGDPYYTPLIEQKKQKVGIMLKNNGQAWYDIIQNSRQFSPKPSYHTSPQTTPPSLVQNNNKNNRVDRKRRRNQLSLQQYGPNQHARIRKHEKNANYHDVKKRRKHARHHFNQLEENDDDEEEGVESDNNSSTTTTTSSSSSCSTVTSPVPTTMIQRRRRGNLPKTVTAVLKQWLVDHCRNPYPTEAEKTGLKDKTGLTLNQISNWFINARRRLLPQIIDTMLPQYNNKEQKVNNALDAIDNEEEGTLKDPIPRGRRKRRTTIKDDYLYAHDEDPQLPSNTCSSSSSPPPPTTIIRKRRRYNKRATNANIVTSSPSIVASTSI